MNKSFSLLFFTFFLNSSCATFKTPNNPCVSDLKTYPNLSAFIQDMPKGGDLHSHLQGIPYAENLLSYVNDRPYFYNPETHMVLFNKEEGSIPLNKVIENPKMKYELIKAWSALDYSGRHGHDHFFNAFTKFKVISSSGVKADILYEGLERAKNQNVSYLEIMVNPLNDELREIIRKTKLNHDIKNEMDLITLKKLYMKKGFSKFTRNLLKDTDKLEKSLEGKLGFNPFSVNESHPITLRFIYQAPRNEERKHVVFGRLLLGFHLASLDKRYVGVNLVTPENGKISLQDYDIHMQMIRYLKKVYPTVSVSLHAGEVTENLADKEKTHSNIYKAVYIAGAKRIGHGVNVKNELDSDTLLKNLHKDNIYVEINLTSNDFILNVKGSEHPLRLYMNYKVPVGLSTDDEGVLRTNMNKEFLKGIKDQNLSYSELKTMVRNTLQYSFISGESLWSSGDYSQKTDACKNACNDFIKNNNKAMLQWKLEKHLELFEKKYCQ